ncbi:hypothetical protein HYW17_01990 [Candidatus Uhrbacteria bacterium]|nr:hypothetical protein [Candidatus Uhrbacteria bacterium]
MSTTTLPLTIIQKTPRKISVEMDRHGFERLADSLGFFGNEFIASIDRAEADIRAGRVRKLKSLRDLRA